jgi:hypothetical protein
MTTVCSRQELYRAAVLETDWTKMQHRIRAVESAIRERKRVLSEDHGGTSAERLALANAIDGMKALRQRSR